MKNYNISTIEELEKLTKSLGDDHQLIAGGTDLIDRLNNGLKTDNLINIMGILELKSISSKDGVIKLGSLATLSELLENELLAGYEGLREGISHIANLQIRNTATVGGNLVQRNRCWYFRNENFRCLKKGGAKCFAREGENRNHAIFDAGPCISVHPSTLGLILLTYDATVETNKRSISITEFFGDGSTIKGDCMLEKGELILCINLLAVEKSEKSKYFRLSKRVLGEWPVVELFARYSLDDNLVKGICLTAGGVAPTPMLLAKVSQFLSGKKLTDENIKRASELAVENAVSFSHNKYKISALKNSMVALLTTLN